jgi:hypothetical protein
MKNQCRWCCANFDFIVHAIRVGHSSQNSAITIMLRCQNQLLMQVSNVTKYHSGTKNRKTQLPPKT